MPKDGFVSAATRAQSGPQRGRESSGGDGCHSWRRPQRADLKWKCAPRWCGHSRHVRLRPSYHSLYRV